MHNDEHGASQMWPRHATPCSSEGAAEMKRSGRREVYHRNDDARTGHAA
jgi:hypothetical protein